MMAKKYDTIQVERKLVNLRISVEMWEDTKALADKRNTSASAIVKAALREYLDKYQDE